MINKLWAELDQTKFIKLSQSWDIFQFFFNFCCIGWWVLKIKLKLTKLSAKIHLNSYRNFGKILKYLTLGRKTNIKGGRSYPIISAAPKIKFWAPPPIGYTDVKLFCWPLTLCHPGGGGPKDPQLSKSLNALK